GRRRLARHLPPARGCARQTRAWGWRPCAPPHAGTDDRSAPSHIQDADRAHFHGTSRLQDRTTLGEFDRVRKVLRLDQSEAVDDILGLGIGPIVDALLLASDDLAGALKRMSRVLDVALCAQLLEPSEPFLHGFLHFLGGLRRRIAATKQKGKFAHCLSSRVGTSHPRRLSEATPDILFWSRPRGCWPPPGAGSNFRALLGIRSRSLLRCTSPLLMLWTAPPPA